MWVSFNPNPRAARVGDCAVRAISKACGLTWEQAYINLTLQGFIDGDLPSANNVWGAYLRKHGFTKNIPPLTNGTVECFANDHPRGVYVIAVNGHVVTVVNGDWFDTWDSGGEVPLYYWAKEN